MTGSLVLIPISYYNYHLIYITVITMLELSTCYNHFIPIVDVGKRGEY